MKKLFCLAAVLAVAACNDNAAEAPVAEDTTALAEAPVEAPAEAAPMALDGKPSAGTFKVTNDDGTVSTFVGNADGTFTATNAAGESVSGTWTEATPGNFCETIDGKETCYTEKMEDGVWTSTGPDGKKSTIERVES